MRSGLAQLFVYTCTAVLAMGLLLGSANVWAQSTPRGLTREEAQALPVADLARRVLGDVGSLMVDVARPAWGTRPILLPDDATWPPQDPPSLNSLVFYGQPRRSQLGLCAQFVVEVSYDSFVDKAGPRMPTGIESGWRYGLSGGPFVRSEDEVEYEHLTKQLGETCAKETGKRDYFPAPDGITAQKIARITLFLADLGTSKAKIQFPVQCSFQIRVKCDIHDQLSRLDLREIRNIQVEDCPSQYKSDHALDCFKITLGAAVREDGMRAETLWTLTLRVVSRFWMNDMTVLATDINLTVAMP